jgi:hypothetical protein
MFFQSRTCTLALIGLLAGCSGSSDHVSVIGLHDGSLINGHIGLNDDKATLHVDGLPDAVISAAGDLSIDDKPVSVDASQRSLLQTYYRNVAGIRDHGIETGKEGAATAGVALKSVASGLANGDTGQIDKQVNAQADKVRQSAMKICQDLADTQTTQNALALQLPAFKPYAGLVADSDVRDCRKE